MFYSISATDLKQNADEKSNPKITDIQKKIQNTFLEKRYIFLWGSVTDKSSQEIIHSLLYLEEQSSKKPIYLFINSPGGSVTAGMAILDAMHIIQAPVYTISTGLAASMGALLFSQGVYNHRYAFPHTRIMIHQPLISGQIIAPTIDIKIHATEIKKTKDEINQLLATATGKAIQQIEKDTDRDYYLNAKEAIKYGIADKIISNLNFTTATTKSNITKSNITKSNITKSNITKSPTTRRKTKAKKTKDTKSSPR